MTVEMSGLVKSLPGLWHTILSHCVPQDGFTGLMGASKSGHTDVVQLLLSSGSKVDLQNKVRHSVNL